MTGDGDVKVDRNGFDGLPNGHPKFEASRSGMLWEAFLFQAVRIQAVTIGSQLRHFPSCREISGVSYFLPTIFLQAARPTAANGGVVFLDEIGEMPLSQQPKLLRVLQERKVQRLGTHTERSVTFRLIAATHVDLKAAVEENRFREDLYFRIAQTVLHIPSLRERSEDIPLFVNLFLKSENGEAEKEISPQAMALLIGYHWRGNIRQLEATVRNLKFMTSGPVIRDKDVCAALPEVAALMPGLTRGPMGSYAQSLLQAEKKKLEDALLRANGYRDEAANLLGLSRATFFRRAKELGIIRTRRTRVYSA